LIKKKIKKIRKTRKIKEGRKKNEKNNCVARKALNCILFYSV
jgi:hypothetical protein